nr:hypothetical protein [Tanacetum cinerariifolium]
MGFTVYQMDVKSSFLYSTIDEEVYVMQPPGFLDLEYSARVYKVEKAMYGLHQAPTAWYGTGKDVDLYLYRSMIGSLMYLTASRLDIRFAVCACARHQVRPKECHLHAVKRIFRYLKGHPKLGLLYPLESPFDLVAYSDSDYSGATEDRKSTTGACHTVLGWVIGTSNYWGVLRILMISLRLIPLFWSTARIETMEEGTKILAIVDGKLRTVSESSTRRNLKLNDECLSPKSTGFNEFGSNIATALVCLATNRVYNFSKMIFDGMMRNVNNKVSKFLMYPSPSFLGRIVPLFDSMLVPHGKDSGTPTESHHTPTSEALQSSQPELPSPSLPPVPPESLPTQMHKYTLGVPMERQ